MGRLQIDASMGEIFPSSLLPFTGSAFGVAASPVGLFRRNDRAQVPESVSNALARRPYLSRIQTARKRIGITSA
jgi:hypothetical protein